MPYMVERLIDESIIVITLHSPIEKQHNTALLAQTYDIATEIKDKGFVIVDVSRMLIPAEHLAQLLIQLFKRASGDFQHLHPVVVGQFNWCESARIAFNQHDSTRTIPLFTFLSQALTYARWRIASKRTLPGAGFAADATSATY